MEKEILTLGDLKDFLSNLSNEQLLQSIQFSPEDEPTIKIYPHVMQDDMYYNTDEFEDCGFWKELEEIHEGEDDFDKANYAISFPKGTVLFYES